MLDELYKVTYVMNTGRQFLNQNQEKFGTFKGRKVKKDDYKKTESVNSNVQGESTDKHQEKTEQKTQHWTQSKWFKFLRTLLIIAILLKVVTYFIQEIAKLIKAAKEVEAAVMG